MVPIWKLIMLLVVLETALLMYYFSLFSNNSIELFSIIKRGNISDDFQMKSNITIETNKYGEKKMNDSSILAYFIKGRRVATENHHKKQMHNVNQNLTVTRNQYVKSIKSPILRHKERSERSGDRRNLPLKKTSNRNKTPSAYMSNLPAENKTACIFSFDKKVLLEAKKSLSKSYYLFYINLMIQDIQKFTEEQQDNLTHWQYVKGKEKFLVQLPVDFDLLTYNLLIVDHEETVLNIPVIYNNHNCSQEFSDQLTNVRNLLWNKLFDNNTDYYLCNRNFTMNKERELLYYLTTIWVGYDLSCSRISTDDEISEFQLKKDHLPLVTPVFCFVLSLQFVWMFALLDVQENHQALTDNPNSQSISCCPEFLETDQKRCYAKKDRPYGLKRLFSKLLYGTYCSIHPVIRLLLLMYIFIFFPFGLYRTLGRKKILSKIYNNYLTVVRPSEPIFRSMCNCSEKTDKKIECAMTLDIIYATVFPIIYIFLGFIFYGIFLSNDSRLWCLKSKHKETPTLFTNSRKIIERFSIRYHQFCRPFQFDFNESMCKQCKYRCRGKDKECFFKRFFCFILTFLKRLIFCLFPIVPFSCWTYRRIDYCVLWTPRCSCTTAKKSKVYTFCLSCVCLFFPLPYLLCLRPMISTFTFLIRSLTYFGFVALPVRVHILRYTILIVTTVTYFSKYFHEIINMNTEILKYIFSLEEKNGDVIESIDEKMFDYVYERLLFVKKSVYFMFLKMIVVFMYLFITIETFLSNKDSLAGSDFKDILEFLLIVIGPYAISFFLKANNENFLSDENKTDIENRHKEYTCMPKALKIGDYVCSYNRQNDKALVTRLLSPDGESEQSHCESKYFTCSVYFK